MQIPVVVVDDEEIDRMIARKRIARSGWSDVLTPVCEAENGDRFLDMLLEPGAVPEGRKLVLMDINMPGRNGFETIEEIDRQISKGTLGKDWVVMMFSSSENAADVARAKSLDLVQGYIVKPFDEDDIEAIARVFGLKRAKTTPDGTSLH